MVRVAFALGSWLSPQRTAQRAARLFATPFASSRSRARAVQGDADMRRATLAIGGETVATYVWGDPVNQPYALLAHGWSSFALRYLPWVARLRAMGLAVVTFDQPGHGHSSGTLNSLPGFAATIGAVGAHYGNAAVAVGHSLGAAALALAQDERWHADKLVLVAPAIDMRAAGSRFFRMVRLGERLRERFDAWLIGHTGVPFEALDLQHHLPARSQPALVVHDLDDTDVPWGEGERCAHYWPGARLLTTQGLGHHRVLDAPEVIDAAFRFLHGEPIGTRVLGSRELDFVL